MSRLLTSLALAAALTAPALAGPGQELADLAADIEQEAQGRAAQARARPAAPAPEMAPGDPLVAQLEQFTVQAVLLGRAVDDAGGPEDLGCIFRGMAADADARLRAVSDAEDGAAEARAYDAIVTLMGQAVQLAPAADHEAGLD
ncbi:hypothetical protein [Maricaulis sp. CAU 1757]